VEIEPVLESFILNLGGILEINCGKLQKRVGKGVAELMKGVGLDRLTS
jgi:hypothetical protein